MPVTLAYFQCGTRDEDEFDTFDDALTAAAWAVADNRFAPDEIRDGNRVIGGKELDELVRERERELGI